MKKLIVIALIAITTFTSSLVYAYDWLNWDNNDEEQELLSQLEEINRQLENSQRSAQTRY